MKCSVEGIRLPGSRLMRWSLLYLALTMAGYVVTYGDAANMQAVLFASICFGALALGWMGSSDRRVQPQPVALASSPPRWLFVVALFAIVVSATNIAAYYSDWATIVKYLGDPGAAYERVKFMRRAGMLSDFGDSMNSAVGLTLTMLGWSRIVSITVFVAYWREFRPTVRILFVGAVVLFVFEALLMGAMVNIAIGLMAAVPGLLLQRRARRASGRRKMVVVSVMFLGVLAAGFFLGSRGNAGHSSISAQILEGLRGLVFYATHGYEGLGYSLTLPFVFSWGHGMFPGLSRVLLVRVTPHGSDLLTYPARVDAAYGWSATQVWSTALPWLASDLTFFLVPAAMFLLGVLLAKVVGDALGGGDFAAVVLLGHLLVALMLLPANNYLFHTFGNSVATCVLLAFYLRSRRRRVVAAGASFNANASRGVGCHGRVLTSVDRERSKAECRVKG